MTELIDDEQVERITRSISVVFQLPEPLLLPEGKWINRFDSRTRTHGYFLPFQISRLEVEGRMEENARGKQRIWFYAQAIGGTITKAGRISSVHSHTFYTWGDRERIPTPPEVIAYINRVRAILVEPYGWPVEGTES
jgi:hypothetical protein